MTLWPRRWMLAMLVSGGLSDTLAQTDPVLAVASAKPVPAVAEPVVADLHAAPALTDELIRQAVRATLAEDPHPIDAAARNGAAYGVATVTSRDRMTQAFNQGKVPDCLHDDALKLQPAQIGPVRVVGPLSLPWLVAAALRGKCR